MCPVQSVLLVPIAHSPEPDLEPAIRPPYLTLPETTKGLCWFCMEKGDCNILREGSQKKCKSVVFDQMLNVEVPKPKKFLNILPKMGLTLVV